MAVLVTPTIFPFYSRPSGRGDSPAEIIARQRADGPHGHGIEIARIGRGNGGFWEDRGYEWYAGI